MLRGLARITLRRLLALPLVVIAVAAMTFLLVALSPFDLGHAYTQGGRGLSGAEADEIARVWNLDGPVHEQFLHWLGNLVRGDLGNSRLLGGQPVLEQIGARLAPSAILVGTALAITVIGGLGAGVAAALFRGRTVDRLVRTASHLSTAAPSFWIGLLLLWFFSLRLGWLPPGGASDLRAEDVPTVAPRHLILPAVTLAATQFGWFAMFVRSRLLEVLRSDHVLFAESLGHGRFRIVARHALPDALLPFLTLVGTHLAELIGGTILVESVFAWPGLGRLTVDAARATDLPLLVGVTLAGSVLIVFGNLLADLSYRIVDPRLREASP